MIRLQLTKVAEDLANALSSEDGVVKATRTDVADASAVEATAQFTVKSFGGLDVTVNAGTGGPLALTGEYPLDG